MKCPKCNIEIDNGSKFCGFCGNHILVSNEPKSFKNKITSKKVSKTHISRIFKFIIFFVIAFMMVWIGVNLYIKNSLEKSSTDTLLNKTIKNESKQERILDKTFDTNNRKNKIFGNAKVFGNDVIIREKPTIKSKILGSIKHSNERVMLLRTSVVENKSQGVLKLDITTKIGKNFFTLKKDKAVSILSYKGDKVYIEFKDLEFNNHRTYVDLKVIKVFDKEMWCYIKRKNGNTGWVYGKFIKAD